jgi:predicted AlkP superfamily pyrophosphatase or phosphodiesterase
MTMHFLIIFVSFILSNLFIPAKDTRKFDHVIIIGIDGMGVNGIENSATPTLDRLMQEGIFTLNARGVLPTSSSPNWASMIMGAGPEQHGITSNDWQKDSHILPPIETGPGGIFPTIFSVIKENNSEAVTGAVYQWNDFGRLFEKSLVNYDTSALGENKTTDLACEFILSEKPEFCFIHIDHVDGAGHKWGYDSEGYHGSIEKADKLINQIFQTIKKAGIAESTLLIVSADHGGNNKGHGGETLNEIRIPVIFWGVGIKRNFEISPYVNIYDIASTTAFALGYDQPGPWIGRPVISVFEDF